MLAVAACDSADGTDLEALQGLWADGDEYLEIDRLVVHRSVLHERDGAVCSNRLPTWELTRRRGGYYADPPGLTVYLEDDALHFTSDNEFRRYSRATPEQRDRFRSAPACGGA